MNSTIKTLTEVLTTEKDKGAKPYDTAAEVLRIDGDTAWCHIVGGIDETPVKMTIAAQEGDTVQVRVSGGRAWITGNQSAPPTDDTVAKAANQKAEDADAKADTATHTAENAAEIAAEADAAARNVNQYFWHTETDTGAGAGAHITEVTQEEFLQDPVNGGGNLLAQSGGIYLREGLEDIASFKTIEGSGYPYAAIDFQDNEKVRLQGRYIENYDDENWNDAVIEQEVMADTQSLTPTWAFQTLAARAPGDGGTHSRNCTYDLYLNAPKNTAGITVDLNDYGEGSAIGAIGLIADHLTINGGVDIYAHYNHDAEKTGDGALRLHEPAYIDNNKFIYSKNAGGTTRSIIGINASDQLVIGYGGYAANEGHTYVEGNAVTLLSKGETKASFDGGTAHSVGTMSSMIVTDHIAANQLEIAAQTTDSARTVTFTKSGYYPFGIMGFSMTGTNIMYCNLFVNRVSARSDGSVTIQYRIRNNSSGKATVTLTEQILWIRD